MLKYPLWKVILTIFVTIWAFVYALPMFFPADPAIQVTGGTPGIVVDKQTLYKTIEAISDENIEYFGESIEGNTLLVRFTSQSDQLRAKDLVQASLGEAYIVALNLANTTPTWLSNLGAKPMSLGLDLQGGVHFQLEVDIEAAIDPHLKSYLREIQTVLREKRFSYRAADYKADEKRLVLAFKSMQARNTAKSLINKDFKQLIVEEKRNGAMYELSATISEIAQKEIVDAAIAQNLTTLRNKVNLLGVSEPLVQRQGKDRIVVELPGMQDTAAAKRIIGRTASLEFRLVDWKQNRRGRLPSRIPYGMERFTMKSINQEVQVLKSVMVKGERVIDAQMGFDENARPQVNITLDSKGGRQMLRGTKDHIGHDMAVLFVEHKSKIKTQLDENGKAQKGFETYVEKDVINVATIQAALGNRFRITGLDNIAEAKELALLLRAGALAAPMYFIEEKTVGPSLGQANIDAGVMSFMIGFIMVLIFMLAFYRLFGLFANMALLLNAAILISAMSTLGATLTLPGIAGIVLTIGMAVDANVLIFSRIREELLKGLSPRQAIEEGYSQAFRTIIDANVTTFIVALVLYLMGTGSVQGFAVTLSIGILSSMFTAITFTRALVQWVYGRGKEKTLSIGFKA